MRFMVSSHLSCSLEVGVQAVIAVCCKLPCSKVCICQQAQVLITGIPRKDKPADRHSISSAHYDVCHPGFPGPEIAAWPAMEAQQMYCGM